MTLPDLSVESMLLTLQLLLLLATLVLVGASVSMSRRRRHWHLGFKLAAVVIAIVASVLAVMTFVESSAGLNFLNAFMPWLLNLVACIWILLRSRVSARLKRHK